MESNSNKTLLMDLFYLLFFFILLFKKVEHFLFFIPDTFNLLFFLDQFELPITHNVTKSNDRPAVKSSSFFRS